MLWKEKKPMEREETDGKRRNRWKEGGTEAVNHVLVGQTKNFLSIIYCCPFFSLFSLPLFSPFSLSPSSFPLSRIFDSSMRIGKKERKRRERRVRRRWKREEVTPRWDTWYNSGSVLVVLSLSLSYVSSLLPLLSPLLSYCTLSLSLSVMSPQSER